MLNIHNIHQYYGSSHTLRGVSLAVKQGECMALLGRNGVGKTTLLKCLMGVLPVRQGQVEFCGQDITRLRPHERAALGMAYVPQGREIFTRLTVEDNLRMGMARLPAGQAKTIPEQVFDLFPVLATMLSRRGGDLSGGQQQQLAIARALVSQPRLIIFDEPTEGIQPSIIKDIARALNLLKKERGFSLIVSEQVLSFAMAVADRYLILEKGEFVHSEVHETLDRERILRYLTI